MYDLCTRLARAGVANIVGGVAGTAATGAQQPPGQTHSRPQREREVEPRTVALSRPARQALRLGNAGSLLYLSLRCAHLCLPHSQPLAAAREWRALLAAATARAVVVGVSPEGAQWLRRRAEEAARVTDAAAGAAAAAAGGPGAAAGVLGA